MTDSTTQEFVPPPVDLMIDIETLDTLPTAQIVEIGLCEIPKLGKKPLDVHEMNSLRKAAIPINPILQFKQGLTKGDSTLKWWMDDEARSAQLGKYYESHVHLHEGLEQLASIIERAKPRHVWCKGSSFDFAILRNAYAACGMPLPWEFRNEKDLRTFKDLVPRDQYEHKRNLIISAFNLKLHNAQDDAILQAYQVADIYDELSFLLGAREGEYDRE